MKFGDILSQARQEAGYSQDALADELGLYQHTISDWELNKTSPPIEKARRILRFLGYEIEFVRNKDDFINNNTIL